MTKNQANFLAKIYQKGIEDVKKIENLDDIKEYLRISSLHSGICHLIDKTIPDISDFSWIDRKATIKYNCGYVVANMPLRAKSKQEVIDLLTIRLDLLKNFPL